MAIDLNTTVGVIILFMTFSVLYKNNILFRMGATWMTVASLGYGVTVAVDSIYNRNIVPTMKGDLQYIPCFILGIMLFFALYRKYSYLSRWPSAIVIGTGLGAATGGILIAGIYRNILATANITSIDIAITSILAVLIMIYFVQTFQRKGPLGYIAKGGQWALVLFYGVGLGTYAVARFSQAIGRIEYVLLTWLGL